MAHPDAQSPEQQAAAIAAMSEQQLGPAPGQGTQPGATPPNATEKDTQMDKATDKGAPTTEGDKQSQDPVMYTLKFGEEERELSEKQITSTFDRYAKLNQMQDFMRPVTALAAQAMKANPGLTPEAFAKSLVDMANSHNTQMGGQDQRPNGQDAAKADNAGQSAEDISAKFEQWEKDNAASLPPGYKDMMANSNQMGGQMQQMMTMMQQILGRSQGMVDASRQSAAQTQDQSVGVIKQRIANNLDSVQAKLQLPDESINDFQLFAAERGYTMEDFVDPALTFRVASDFKNNMNSGEMTRLKEMAQRRQAFTGTHTTQPGQGGATEQQGDPNLEAMINRRLG